MLPHERTYPCFHLHLTLTRSAFRIARLVKYETKRHLQWGLVSPQVLLPRQMAMSAADRTRARERETKVPGSLCTAPTAAEMILNINHGPEGWRCRRLRGITSVLDEPVLPWQGSPEPPSAFSDFPGAQVRGQLCDPGPLR